MHTHMHMCMYMDTYLLSVPSGLLSSRKGIGHAYAYAHVHVHVYVPVISALWDAVEQEGDRLLVAALGRPHEGSHPAAVAEQHVGRAVQQPMDDLCVCVYACMYVCMYVHSI